MTTAATVSGGAPIQVAEEKYSAVLVLEAAGARVVLKGTISTENPQSVLNPFVDAVHAHAVQAGATEVRVDLRTLEFCNSSGFKAFIHWIQLISELPEPRKYRLRFMSAPTRRWQRTSLLALSCYGVNTVAIE
jgi:hypothetical protein